MDRRRESSMNISDAIGLLTAIIGVTTTIHGGWKYLSSSERSKKERLGAVAVVVVIMTMVAGVATGISHATASTPVGQKTIPVPFVPTAAPTAPANPATPQTGPTAPPASTPTPQLSPTSASTPPVTPTAAPEPRVTPPSQPGKK